MNFHDEERKLLVKKNQELLKELAAIKVSLYIHPSAQHHNILLFVAYQRIVCMYIVSLLWYFWYEF
jgi:hypothetical protein